MHAAAEILLALLTVFVAAQVGAEIAQRLRLPSVVGEIVAGAAIGPSALGWIDSAPPLEALAEFGVVLLLFSVGLETRLSELRRIGVRGFLVGLSGVIVPFALGAIWGKFAGFDTPKAMFVAAAFVATSAGITASVLRELGVLDRIESRIILAAAVIDDILAMLLLGVVTSFTQLGEVNAIGMTLLVAEAAGFIALVALVGAPLMRGAGRVLDWPVAPLSPLTLCIALCLGLAVAAEAVGLAAIIGAFLAGAITAETPQRETIERQLAPILALVTPFFFVATGAKVVLGELASLPMLGTLALITALAFAGKLIGCGLAAWPLGARSALIIGVGMTPRGEVGIVVASLGLAAGAFARDTYALIIAMSLLTSVLAPPLLRMLFRRA